MKTIYFVRRSIRDISNKDDETAPLTAAGHQHAQALVSFFKDKSIEQILLAPIYAPYKPFNQLLTF